MDSIDIANDLIEQQESLVTVAVDALDLDQRRAMETDAFMSCLDALDDLRIIGSMNQQEADQVQAVLQAAIERARLAVPSLRLPGITTIDLTPGEHPSSFMTASESLGNVWTRVADLENDPEDNRPD